MPREMSLLIKGAMHPNFDGTNRLFEITMLNPGDRLELRTEPNNKFDPGAIAILTDRGFQIGYVSAERCGLIGSRMRAGAPIVAVFQEKANDGGIIRVNFEGDQPTLPVPAARTEEDDWRDEADTDFGFYPDEIPPED